MFKSVFRILRFSLFALFVLVGVTFAVSNRAQVDLTFYPFPYSLSVPMYIVAVTLFVSGLITAWLIIRFAMFKERMGHKRTVKRMQALENEISALRSEQLLRQQPQTTAQIGTSQ